MKTRTWFGTMTMQQAERLEEHFASFRDSPKGPVWTIPDWLIHLKEQIKLRDEGQ